MTWLVPLAVIVFFGGIVHVWILILQNTKRVAGRIRKMEETDQFQLPYRMPWFRRPGFLLLLYLLVAGTLYFAGMFRFPVLPD